MRETRRARLQRVGSRRVAIGRAVGNQARVDSPPFWGDSRAREGRFRPERRNTPTEPGDSAGVQTEAAASGRADFVVTPPGRTPGGPRSGETSVQGGIETARRGPELAGLAASRALPVDREVMGRHPEATRQQLPEAIDASLEVENGIATVAPEVVMVFLGDLGELVARGLSRKLDRDQLSRVDHAAKGSIDGRQAEGGNLFAGRLENFGGSHRADRGVDRRFDGASLRGSGPGHSRVSEGSPAGASADRRSIRGVSKPRCRAMIPTRRVQVTPRDECVPPPADPPPPPDRPLRPQLCQSRREMDPGRGHNGALKTPPHLEPSDEQDLPRW